jgi:CRISPR-associated protein Csx10
MKLEITFLSDWHVGEGAGALGHIDRIVRRHPEDDLPFVPAKTLTGILRDACERVAHGLDDGSANGPWQNFVATLFGRQSTGTANTGHTTPALVRIGDGRFPENLRQALRQQQELKSALTFIKPGVKLDDEGVAQSRMLRMEEMVVTESQLSAELELDGYLDDATRRVALTLLAAGCRAVERLGAKRRRGHGRCQLTISGDPVVERPDWSLLDNDPPAITPPATASHLVLTPVTHAQPQGWHVLALDLTLLSPVVIPDGTAGNVIATRDHIPGALLLPALDKTLRQLLGERGHELTAHLAAGRVQIRNGYLCEGSERLLPAPLCLMAEKEHPGAIINELYGHRSDGIQRKQLRTGYLPVKGVARNGSEKSPVRNPDKIAATHAVIDDQVQRPTKTVGGVYTYEAIAPGQRFRPRHPPDTS